MLILLLIFFTIGVFNSAITPQNTITNNKYTSNFFIYSLLIYIAILIVTVENNSIDMVRYLRHFNVYVNNNYSILAALEYSNYEPLFTLLQWGVAKFTSSTYIFYLSVWAIISTLLLISLRKLFKPGQVLIVLFSYLNYFIFFTYATSAIRQGIAISFILLAVCVLVSGQKKSRNFYTPLLIAPFFHISSIPLSVALFSLSKVNFKFRTLVVIWMFSAISLITNFNQIILGGLANYFTALESYTSSQVLERYSGTNRLDFLLFSSFILFVSLYFWKYISNKNKKYAMIIKIYLIFNSYFLLFGFIGYSDRLAAYSWYLGPILILYPLLKYRSKKTIGLTILSLVLFITLAVIQDSFLYSLPFL